MRTCVVSSRCAQPVERRDVEPHAIEPALPSRSRAHRVSMRDMSGTNACSRKRAARREVRGDVAEAPHLRLLRRQHEERVEHDEDERERRRRPGRRPCRRSSPGSRRRPACARICSTIAGDASMPCTSTPVRRERQRDPTGTDAELERPPAAGELGEERALRASGSRRACTTRRRRRRCARRRFRVRMLHLRQAIGTHACTSTRH